MTNWNTKGILAVTELFSVAQALCYIYFQLLNLLLQLENYNDKELIKRLHHDDMNAFDTIYLKYHQPLYSNILKLSKDAAASKDLLQEVFITLWEKRLTLDENKPVANWLFTVSYNKSVNYLKQVLRESVRLKDFNEKVEADEEKETCLREIRLCMIENAVKNLSPQKSRVFDLCKLQGKTYDETAKELNISKHTVKEYLVEAIINIKDYIKQHPESSTAFFCAGLFPFSM